MLNKDSEPVRHLLCDTHLGNYFPNMDNDIQQTGFQVLLPRQFPMLKMPNGIVTVHLDGERYRGAYYYQGEELVVKAYGLKKSSANMALLQGERGKAAYNLAKLVLIDMVRDATDVLRLNPGLSLQGSTTICLQGSTTQIGF